MRVNLGKNLLKLLFILVITQIYLLGDAKLNAPNSFYSGEQVVFSIRSNGTDIEFPKLDKIENFPVQNAGTSSSTSIINGVRSQTLKRTFSFRPNRSITIPSFDIKIDGKIIKTKPKKILIKEIKKTISPNYELKIEVNKKDVFVGEDLLLKLTFKYKKDLQIVDLEFTKPSFENFWLKELKSNNTQNSNGDFATQELNYLLFPQKSV